jgi:exodeoxyribonuclease V beta subunit
MIQHDYVLQYLLYTIAVDRHLASRLADYDYDRDFGGAYYLFLRGMAEGHEPGCGIFFDRPDRDTVQRVSALLGPAGGEER